MGFKVYPYLGEYIAIEGPDHLLLRASGNIDGAETHVNEWGGIVRVSEGDLRKIIRDKSADYLTVKENCEKDMEGLDFIRYRTHVQTIWKLNPLEYHIRNHLCDDESGVLKCFKKIYYALPSSAGKSLIHAASINLPHQGILFVGRKRCGKTTLAFNMIDRLGASMVDGGNTLISFNKELSAHYLPRPIFARFSTISSSPYLSCLLEDLSKTESQQPWDIEGIQEVISNRNFSVDGGLNFSRRAFRNLSGRNTESSAVIKKILFPVYSPDGVRSKTLSIEEACKRLKEREFEIDPSLGKMQDQSNIIRPLNSQINYSWLEGIKLLEFSFDGNNDLSRSLLEDLAS